MTLNQRITALYTAIAAAINTDRTNVGALSGLGTTNQTSIVEAINEVWATSSQSVSLIGDLNSLSVTGPNESLVAAINKVFDIADDANNKATTLRTDFDTLINDSTPGTGQVFSSQAVVDRLVELKDQILGGASPSYDTLLELQQALEGADVTGLLAAIGNRVRFDEAQVLNSTQQQTARSNIGAAAAADVTALSDSIGETDTDFAAAFNGLLSA